MTSQSVRLFVLSLLISIGYTTGGNAQFVGIGTTTPDYKLHVAGNTAAILKIENVSTLATDIPTNMYFKTGAYYTGGIKTIGNGINTARLAFFTYAAANQSQLLERLSIMDNGFVGVGTTSPQLLLDVNGRIRVRHNGGNTAGIAFTESTGAINRGFVGMVDDNRIGFFGWNGAGWGLTMHTTTGDVVMNHKLYVQSADFIGAEFSTTSNDEEAIALKADADYTAGHGIGVDANGGQYGVRATAGMGGTGQRYGVWAFGSNGTGNNYGIYASGNGGNNAYGIYATATAGTTTWGGYFSGSVYTTGSYQGSDRKLKQDIQPLRNALPLIQGLKPATYSYNTGAFDQMHLPSGQQYGLIADEVKQVLPGLVKRAVQPARYENDDPITGKVLVEEVTFEAVNYTALIPVLISAMQEQQAMIDAQQKRIEELEMRL